jgi:putative transposase
MPRIARAVIPGCPHHVTQRGNNRQDVFFVDDDRRAYLELLGRQAGRFGLAVHAYCLMSNHVHLIATPERADSLARALGRAHFLYTLYVNRLHGRLGHLWQNRFFSCALDDERLWTALAYVERNPVRAGLARRAWKYPWSSAAAHCGMAPPGPPLDTRWWEGMIRGRDWSEALRQPQDDAAVVALRASTRTGRPLGSDSFISKLETALGRRLRPLPVGRPKRAKGRKRPRGNR